MNPQDLLDQKTPPIAPDLLGFGIGVFQAAIAGDLQSQVPMESSELLAEHGIQVLQHEIEGHGLSDGEEISLMFRVLAFPQLLEAASADDRTRQHVVEVDEGYAISEAFLRAAARCGLRADDAGVFGFDLESLVAQMAH